jgi:Protein of unknown function (DUF3631)
MKQETILDKNREQLERHLVFNFPEQYDTCALWILGTYLLKHVPGMKVARMFPMLGFVSPEPDSGKSTALRVVNVLCHNSTKRGKRTPASILGKIDETKDDKITIALDELDKVFRYGADNQDLISLFNLGYEWDAVIARCDRFKTGENETSAYCPKLFAALSLAVIPDDTRSRCILIPMRPKNESDPEVLEYDDYEALAKVQKANLQWSLDTSMIEKLTNVELTDIDFLANRNKQIWSFMLAIAKVVDGGWYERAKSAAKFFTENQRREKGLYHKILVTMYMIVKESSRNATHSQDIVVKLQADGMPKYVDESFIAKCFREYDPDIKPRQVKINQINRKGYDHSAFENAFRLYKIREEVDAVDQVDGLETSQVDPVDRGRYFTGDQAEEIKTCFASVSAPVSGLPVSTPSTWPTLPTVVDVLPQRRVIWNGREAS